MDTLCLIDDDPCRYITVEVDTSSPSKLVVGAMASGVYLLILALLGLVSGYRRHPSGLYVFLRKARVPL